MEKAELFNLKNIILSLPFEEREEIYSSCFSTGYLGTKNLNDRLILLSLLALVYQKMKLKDNKITHLDILLKITNQKKDDSSFYKFLESVAILSKDLSYGIEIIDSCGLKTSQEIINKIKELLNTWIPF